MKVQIETAQPQIVDNSNGLLTDFKLIAAQVGEPTSAAGSDAEPRPEPLLLRFR